MNRLFCAVLISLVGIPLISPTVAESTNDGFYSGSQSSAIVLDLNNNPVVSSTILNLPAQYDAPAVLTQADAISLPTALESDSPELRPFAPTYTATEERAALGLPASTQSVEQTTTETETTESETAKPKKTPADFFFPSAGASTLSRDLVESNDQPVLIAMARSLPSAHLRNAGFRRSAPARMQTRKATVKRAGKRIPTRTNASRAKSKQTSSRKGQKTQRKIQAPKRNSTSVRASHRRVQPAKRNSVHGRNMSSRKMAQTKRSNPAQGKVIYLKRNGIMRKFVYMPRAQAHNPQRRAIVSNNGNKARSTRNRNFIAFRKRGVAKKAPLAAAPNPKLLSKSTISKTEHVGVALPMSPEILGQASFGSEAILALPAKESAPAAIPVQARPTLKARIAAKKQPKASVFPLSRIAKLVLPCPVVTALTLSPAFQPFIELDKLQLAHLNSQKAKKNPPKVAHHPHVKKWKAHKRRAMRMKIASNALSTAKKMNTVGYCYRGVTVALKPLGINLSGMAAYMAKDQLNADPRFQKVAVNEISDLHPGDIVVHGPTRSHPYGHIGVYLGNEHEASDHVQKAFLKGPYSGTTVFRYEPTTTEAFSALGIQINAEQVPGQS